MNICSFLFRIKFSNARALMTFKNIYRFLEIVRKPFRKETQIKFINLLFLHRKKLKYSHACRRDCKFFFLVTKKITFMR